MLHERAQGVLRQNLIITKPNTKWQYYFEFASKLDSKESTLTRGTKEELSESL
jgi:hypothetical protein